MLWARGEIVPDNALSVSVLDRTFEHGLGLFETFRTWNGQPTLLDRHLARLQNSARELGLPLEPAQLPCAQAVAKLIAASRDLIPPGHDARLRITLSGGLATTPASGSLLWMTAGPLPPLPPPAGQVGAVITQSIVVPADDPLSRHKTLNYWRKRNAHARAIEAGSDEVLCLTPDRLICEASRSNIFLVRHGRLETPAAQSPLLPGIMRQLVLETARKSGVQVAEESLPIERIATADEAFLTSSVRGIVPLARLLNSTFAAPGPCTLRLRHDILRALEQGGTGRQF